MTTGDEARAAQWDEDRLTEFLAPKMLDIVEHESKGTVVSLRDQARAGMWARSVARCLLHAGLALPRAEAGTLDVEPDGLRVAYGCHRHGGWHHHGDFVHAEGPEHEAARHVHLPAAPEHSHVWLGGELLRNGCPLPHPDSLASLDVEQLYSAMKKVEDHGKPLTATDYLAVAAEYARLAKAEREDMDDGGYLPHRPERPDR